MPCSNLQASPATRILVVDDNPGDITLMQYAFANQNDWQTELEFAKDGEEAMERILSPARKPDMVILDLTMPKLDGTEVLRQIRQVTPYIPVAIYSNLPEDVLISKVRETNQQADGYFTKPSRLEALETVALDFRRCYEAVAIRLQ